MNCDAARTLLAWDDLDAPPDLDGLRAHLGVCRACAGDHPEVVRLLAAATAPLPGPLPPLGPRVPIQRPIRRRARVLAAAAAVLVAAGVWRGLDRPPPPARPPVAPPPTVGVAPGGGSAFRWTITTYHRDTRSEISVAAGTWAARPPAGGRVSLEPAR